jgi:hypothetical protein
MQRFNENDAKIMNGSKAGSQTKSLKSRSQLNSVFGREKAAEADRKSQISKQSVFSKASFMRKK